MNDENANRVMELWKSINISETPIKKKLQLEIINQIASTFTVGKYYFMVFNFNGLKLDYVDPGVKDMFGIDAKDWSLKFFFDLLHPDDLVKLHDKESVAAEFLYSKISKEEIPFYKVVYLLRIRHINGDYKTILHQSRAINVSDEGKIQQVLTVHSDVTFLDIPFNHNISFISQELPSFFATEKESKYVYSKDLTKNKFTKREIEIIKKISEGKIHSQIAEELFVAKNTINFHRKNILRKSGCKNSAQLIAQCVKEGII